MPTLYLTACQIPFPAEIAKVGRYNEIGNGVQFLSFKNCIVGPVEIGDCNVIHEGVRILVGRGGFRMGDYNVIHRNTTIIGEGIFSMGHNCWIGQDSWLNCTGSLEIGNGATMGLSTHIWTHVARGERIEGWRFDLEGKVVIGDDVWLVGNDVYVAPNVRMGARSVALAHAVVTHDTQPDMVYAGIPARPEKVAMRRDVSLGEKWDMMWGWAREFDFTSRRFVNYIEISRNGDLLHIGPGPIRKEKYDFTYLDMTTKTYTKRLTRLERDFVAFLRDDDKARFIPV